MEIATKSKLFILPLLVAILNIMDAFLSMFFIKFGPLQEINPLTAWLLHNEPNWFLFYKVYLVTTLLIVLCEYSHLYVARAGLYSLFFVYSATLLAWSYVFFLYV